MFKNKYFEENGYKRSYEKTDETPYYYDTEYAGRIWCDHALFRALRTLDEKEYKRRDNESRCTMFNKNGLIVKCRLKCSTECPFGPNHARTGSTLSIEAMQQGNQNIDFVDNIDDPKHDLDFKELKSKLKLTLAELSPEDRFIYTSIRLNEESERAVAKRLGVSQPTIHQRLQKISKDVKEKLKEFSE